MTESPRISEGQVGNGLLGFHAATVSAGQPLMQE